MRQRFTFQQAVRPILQLQSLPAISFFEHPLSRITHEAGRFIQLQWRAGSRDVTAVQAIFEQVLLIYQRTACPRLLIDERLAGSFGEEAKRWLHEHRYRAEVPRRIWLRLAAFPGCPSGHR